MDDNQHTEQITTGQPVTRRRWRDRLPLATIGAGIGGLALGAILTAVLTGAFPAPLTPARYVSNDTAAVRQYDPAQPAVPVAGAQPGGLPVAGAVAPAPPPPPPCGSHPGKGHRPPHRPPAVPAPAPAPAAPGPAPAPPAGGPAPAPAPAPAPPAGQPPR